jgi:hypothetical protein
MGKYQASPCFWKLDYSPEITNIGRGIYPLRQPVRTRSTAVIKDMEKRDWHGELPTKRRFIF